MCDGSVYNSIINQQIFRSDSTSTTTSAELRRVTWNPLPQEALLTSDLIREESGWWERKMEKERRAGTRDSTIHLSLILRMIPSLCLSGTIPLSLSLSLLMSLFDSVVFPFILVFSSLFPFSSTLLALRLSLCLPIHRSSSQKPPSPPFSSFLPQHLPSFHPSTTADFLLLKTRNIGETETCQVCVCECV